MINDTLTTNILEAIARYSAKQTTSNHFKLHGLSICIETPKGQRRRPDWPEMPADYGFIKKTEGADGDEVDVFIGPHRQSEMVYVIDQCDQQGQFDEHKVMLGYTNYKKAMDAYRAAYCKGWKIGKVTSLTIEQLKNWLATGDQRSGIENQVSRYSRRSIRRYAGFMQPGLFDFSEGSDGGKPPSAVKKPPRSKSSDKQPGLFDSHSSEKPAWLSGQPPKQQEMPLAQPAAPQSEPKIQPQAGIKEIIPAPKSVPNVEAKPGQQLGLFGDAPIPKSKAPKLDVGREGKARQGSLFDTHGQRGQQFLFGDSVTPEELVYKPNSPGAEADLPGGAPEGLAKESTNAPLPARRGGLASFINKSQQPKVSQGQSEPVAGFSSDNPEFEAMLHDKPAAEPKQQKSGTDVDSLPLPSATYEQFRGKHKNVLALLLTGGHEKENEPELIEYLDTIRSENPEHFDRLSDEIEKDLNADPTAFQSSSQSSQIDIPPESLEHPDSILSLGQGGQREISDHEFNREMQHPGLRPYLLKVARSMTKDQDEAEDIVQKAMLAAYQNRHSYDPSRNLATWMRTILERTNINHYRDKKAAKRGGGANIQSMDAPGINGENNVGMHDSLSQDRRRSPVGASSSEEIDDLREATRVLGGAQKRVVDLYLKNMSLKDISIKLGISQAAAGQALKRAIENMRPRMRHSWMLDVLVERYRLETDQLHYEMCERVYRYAVLGEKDRYESGDSSQNQASDPSALRMHNGTAIAQRPESTSPDHSLHLSQVVKNPTSAHIGNTLHRIGMSLNDEWSRAHERQQRMGDAYQTPYHHVDWNRVKGHLDTLNKIHRENLSQGHNVANIANYNGTIPQWLIPKLAGGRKFIDPSLLGSRWVNDQPPKASSQRPRGAVAKWNPKWQPGPEHQGFPTSQEAHAKAREFASRSPKSAFVIAQHPQGLWYVARHDSANQQPAPAAVNEQPEKPKPPKGWLHWPGFEPKGNPEGQVPPVQPQASENLQPANNEQPSSVSNAPGSELLPEANQPHIEEQSPIADGSGQPSLNGNEPQSQGGFVGQTRTYNSGMNRGTLHFESELHRLLYDLGAKTRHNRSAGNSFNPAPIKDTQSVMAKLLQHPEIQKAMQLGHLDQHKLVVLASDVHEHTKSQMKGLREGEHRKTALMPMPWASSKELSSEQIASPEANPMQIPSPEANPVQIASPEAKPEESSVVPENPIVEPSDRNPIGIGAVRQDGTPHAPDSSEVYKVPVSSLSVDPSKFQYKVKDIDKTTGVTSELSDSKKWNKDLSGTLLVWRDPQDGKDYVVNGHHRHHHATRLGVEDINVRYIQAPDSVAARAVGALANIAEGRGSAIDAAKYLRDSGHDIAHLQDAGISMKGAVASKAAILKDLADKPFQMVTEGRLDENKAVAVAKHLKNPELQEKLFKKIDERESQGKEWTLREIETASRKMANAGKFVQSGFDLFGDFQEEKDLFDQEVEIEAHIGKLLSQEALAFKAVGSERKAQIVSDAGNVLAVDENRRRAQLGTQDLDAFDREAQYKGPISQLIKQYAEKLALATTKKDKDAIKVEAFNAAKQALADLRAQGGSLAEKMSASFAFQITRYANAQSRLRNSLYSSMAHFCKNYSLR